MVVSQAGIYEAVPEPLLRAPPSRALENWCRSQGLGLEQGINATAEEFFILQKKNVFWEKAEWASQTNVNSFLGVEKAKILEN